MLGQYKILSEILIFAIGIAITSYVVLSFSGVRDFIGVVSAQDKLENVANMVINTVVKSAEDNSFLVMEIPETISGSAYFMKMVDRDGDVCDKGEECFVNLTTSVFTGISVKKQLFNISQNYNIKGDVHSTARFLTIYSKEDEITLGRI